MFGTMAEEDKRPGEGLPVRDVQTQDQAQVGAQWSDPAPGWLSRAMSQGQVCGRIRWLC